MYTNELGRIAPKSYLFYSQEGNRKWNEPDWNVIPTKGMKIPPEHELVQQIKELGKKEALAKSDDEIRTIRKQYSCLMAQYMSSVSPDRKSLHKQAMDIIPRISAGATTGSEPIHKSLAEFLNERDGIGRPVYIKRGFPYPLPLPSGRIQPITETVGGFGYKVYATGEPEPVLTGRLGDWRFTPTSAEMERSSEFLNIYRTERDLVMRMELEPEHGIESTKQSVNFRA